MSEAQVALIEGQIAWRVKQMEQSKRRLGVCDELNLSIEAESLDELNSLISETVHLLMADLLEDNELHDFLRERGWKTDALPKKDYW